MPTQTVKSSARAARADQRRQQILNAALGCFRREGFHGASMDQISKAAGMSVGHIYHYFENKEAIIAAIVERDVAELEADFEKIRASADVAAAMVQHAAGVIARGDHASDGGFRLEMLAEATRSPRIAAILQDAHREIGRMVVDTMRHANPGLSEAEAQTKFELLGALFAGLDIAMVRSPGLDRARLSADLLKTIQHVLGETKS
ncbi:TetR/AcrR family transcriptional regulator [Dongia sedimenti]|uniref:TetR/AcrR family transcriptional regulator n=1 Tax=Dongia sedimenti TaxID=3064282 RepID=A0ABU0YLJ0_9PROT|nr:TetR/AcrR family transcriptional regulator [Rhodospirillaceae bacterium R-7]